MSEIKEYKVITVFPTATKDYQIGEIIKKGTALFKKAHKFPKFFEPIEETSYKIGDIVVVKYTEEHCVGWEETKGKEQILQISYYKNNPFQFPKTMQKAHHSSYIGFENNSIIFSSEEDDSYIVRKATPEEIKQYNFPKVGDVIVKRKSGYFNFIPNVTEVTKITDKDHIWVRETNGGDSWTRESEHHKYYRKATKEETVEYKKSKEKCVTVSNNSISLEIKKDGVITCGRGKFKIEDVKKLYLAMNALVGITIGSWSSTIADDNARFIRIGCKDENFLVSRNDLKNVIFTFESIK